MAARARIGVVVDTLGKLNSAALRYAVLKLNSLQSFAEYEIIYSVDRNHSFIKLGSSGSIVDREDLDEKAGLFKKSMLDKLKNPLDFCLEYTKCDRYVAVCNCRLEDGYYNIRLPNSRLRILAIGDWSRQMAPPSLLEFVIDSCIKQGARQAFAIVHGHVASRGCIFDFNEDLENTRNGVLIGYICEECKDVLAAKSERWQEIQNVIGGRWLGMPTDPFSAHSELQRLGFQPFKASGLKNSIWQNIKNSVTTKFSEEITKQITVIIILIFLLQFNAQHLLGR